MLIQTCRQNGFCNHIGSRDGERVSRNIQARDNGQQHNGSKACDAESSEVLEEVCKSLEGYQNRSYHTFFLCYQYVPAVAQACAGT